MTQERTNEIYIRFGEILELLHGKERMNELTNIGCGSTIDFITKTVNELPLEERNECSAIKGKYDDITEIYEATYLLVKLVIIDEITNKPLLDKIIDFLKLLK